LTIEAQARAILSDAIAAKGAAWTNTAHSVRAGTYGNQWTEFALAAIEEALRHGPEPDE